MNKPLNIRVVCEMPLRDYPSFEELLDGVGVKAVSHELTEADQAVEEPPATERKSSAGYRKTTPEDLAKLRAYLRENPHTTQMGAARALGFPFASGTMCQMFKKIRIQKALESSTKKSTTGGGDE